MRWIIPVICACVLIATCTQARAFDYRPNEQPVFGTFSQKYLDRQQKKRWKVLCRYDRQRAASEAHSVGKPDPCRR